MAIYDIRNHAEINGMTASGVPSISKTLTAQYDETSPTYFDCARTREFAVSIQSLSGGVLVDASDFVVDLMRSLDNGRSWQKYTSYAAQTETFVSCGTENILWKFILSTAGAKPVVVRART